MKLTNELNHYYALQLWHDYLRAKAEWEHAHGEYTFCPLPIPKETRQAEKTTRERMGYLLHLLRQTPEHTAAFGW